jgi:hypothetical protein
VADTAHVFLEALRAGTANKGATLVIWHLVRTLNGSAKVDIPAPTEGWSLKVRPSPDARYVNLVDGELRE